MSDTHKTCPNCGSANNQLAVSCSTCGKSLSAPHDIARQERHTQQLDFRLGETDLMESSLYRYSTALWLIVITVVLASSLAVLGLMLLSGALLQESAMEENNVPVTGTPRPTLNLPVVTAGPPTSTYTLTPPPTLTPSPTPTRGPCVQTIPQGGNLITAIVNCGHRTQDIVPTVLALNDLPDANTVRVGQQILIPWPTATTDPNQPPTETPSPVDEVRSDDEGQDVLMADTSIVAFGATVTPTLPAGIAWHTVQPDENIIVIALQYNTDVKTLSELNREIDFARCDFGETYGGPECLVQLFQGQIVRVPAATPTPTLPPTIDPNSTATPTPTATVNIPAIYSPTESEFFYGNELVTLRWTASATLHEAESYRVDVYDVTSDLRYSTLTTELAFTIPGDWQGKLRPRHEYQWTVGIVDRNAPETIRQQTSIHTFVWQGTTESD